MDIDPIVSSTKYEVFKAVYSTHGTESDDKARLSVIQNTLAGLPLTNIATLDAITTHFTRLIDLTSADEAYVSALAHNLANCILRPRVESPLTQHERHAYRLVRDLFAHKDQIFGELKRASTVATGRARAVSTDESRRKEAMEARARAVIARSRPSSPAPPTNRHRRENSSVDTGAATRFPVATSSSPTGKRVYRPNSLEVPGMENPLPPTPADEPAAQITSSPDEVEPPRSSTPVGVEKSNSITRNSFGGGTGRFPRRPNSQALARAAVGKRDSIPRAGAIEDEEGRPRGYSLTDRPMDD